MAKVIEYLGLPGTGKSWQLQFGNYHKRDFARAHIVKTGKGFKKVIFMMKGFFSFPQLLPVLLLCIYKNRHCSDVSLSYRPIGVIFERTGRIQSLSREKEMNTVYIDEGVFQFIWRFFSNLPHNQNNIMILQLVVAQISPFNRTIAYLECPKRSVHISRLIKRNKKQPFDSAVASGDQSSYTNGRKWMLEVLKAAKKYGTTIIFMKNSYLIG